VWGHAPFSRKWAHCREKKKSRHAGRLLFTATAGSGQFAFDQHRDVDHDVGVQGDLDRVLADGLELTIGQTDLSLFDGFERSLLQTFGDVGVGDRTDQ